MGDGFFGDLFDLDGNGKLDSFEETLDLMAFTDLISDDQMNNPAFDFGDDDADDI